MLHEKDIETFIKAKKDQVAIDVLQGLSLLSLATLITLEVVQANHDYTVLLSTFAVVFMGGAMGQSKWVSVSRSQLIKTLENIINNDAEALITLSRKRGNNRDTNNSSPS